MRDAPSYSMSRLNKEIVNLLDLVPASRYAMSNNKFIYNYIGKRRAANYIKYIPRSYRSQQNLQYIRQQSGRLWLPALYITLYGLGVSMPDQTENTAVWEDEVRQLQANQINICRVTTWFLWRLLRPSQKRRSTADRDTPNLVWCSEIIYFAPPILREPVTASPQDATTWLRTERRNPKSVPVARDRTSWCYSSDIDNCRRWTSYVYT